MSFDSLVFYVVLQVANIYKEIVAERDKLKVGNLICT